MPIFIPGPAVMKICMGSIYRDTEGTQEFSGLGFKPRVVFFFLFALGSNAECWSNGADDGVYHYCTYKIGDTEEPDFSDSRSIVVMTTSVNRIRAYISSIGPDGFTLTWDLAGTVVARGIYVALG